MDIHKIFVNMAVEHKCIGNREFDTLGLNTSEVAVPFCTFIVDLKYAADLSPNAVVVLTSPVLKNKINCNGLCVVKDPRQVFFRLHNYLADSKQYARKTVETSIGKNCKISPLASIDDNNVTIGEDVIIEEFASIKENVKIGNHCIIRAGSIIGGEGFEFKRNEQNDLFGVKHLGGVVLTDNVEIQQSVCIDRAVYPWDDTVIGANSKIDNLVHIAHGVKIGSNTMIVANSGIGGRAIIGNDCWIGFGATIRNGITIGDNARVNMGAVVTKAVKAEDSVTGNFAIEHQRFLSNLKKSIQEND